MRSKFDISTQNYLSHDKQKKIPRCKIFHSFDYKYNIQIGIHLKILDRYRILSLTLKAPITTAADNIHKYFFIVSRENKNDISCESSARQRIHMKQQALFCLKDESKKK